MTLHIDSLLDRWFTSVVKTYFLREKNQKNFKMSSAAVVIVPINHNGSRHHLEIFYYFKDYGVVKVLCILRHRSIQLILGYSLARPIHVAGKGTGGMFLFLLILHFHSFSCFFPVSLWETTQNDPQELTCC